MVSKFWKALESVPGLAAVRAEWKSHLGDEFEVIRAAYFRNLQAPATSHPCPKGCGCCHRVVRHLDRRIVAVCQCESWNCDDLVLTEADLVPHELNWSILGRALSVALGCDPKPAPTHIPGVWQIATFSGVALPIFLSIQIGPEEFWNALAHLAAATKPPSVVLAPTSRWMDARGHVLLGEKRAFFDIESRLEVLEGGRFYASKPVAELFSALVPKPGEDVAESEQTRVWILFDKLAEIDPNLKAPPIAVFNSMVLKGRSRSQTAEKLRCSASLITKRVKRIEDHFKISVAQFQAYVPGLLGRQKELAAGLPKKRKEGGYSADDRGGGADETDDLKSEEE